MVSALVLQCCGLLALGLLYVIFTTGRRERGLPPGRELQLVAVTEKLMIR